MKPYFFIIVALLPLLAQGYVTWHFYQILPLPSWGKAVVATLLTCCFAAFFAIFIFGEKSAMWLTTLLYVVGTSWLVVLLYATLAFAVLDLGRLVRLVPPTLLRDSLAGSAAIIGLLAALMCYGGWRYHSKERTVIELQAPPGKVLTRPVTAVMMSDLHLGYHNRRGELARWVDMVNAERPDVVLIAGDIIDKSVRPLLEEDMAAELRRINAPVIACLGNHEYFATCDAARRVLDDAGITLLVDSCTTVGQLTVIGRDDRTNRRRQPLASLMAAADTTRYTIVLDHQPANLEEAQRCGADLQLSGHTHRGQVWPVSWITDAMYEVSHGFKQKGATAVYVSSGMGIWGGKFRIGTVSEYVVIKIF